MHSPKPVPAVICGDLNMVRCFAGSGIPTVVVCVDPQDVTFASRYCGQRRIVSSPLAHPQQAADDLVALGKEFTEPPVLYYADDAMLPVVSRYRDRLAEYYRFLLPEPQLLEDLAGKLRFAGLAQRLNLPVPRTLLSSEIASADEALARLSLPLVLKPNSHVGWFRSPVVMELGAKPRKVLRADTPEQFRHHFEAIRRYTSDFVLQEYIPGSDDRIYSFHGYFNRQGELLAHFVGKKIRTYPKDSGLSTYLELVHAPEVARLGIEVLQKLNFVGPVKIDFKQDPLREKLFILEINARYNLWHYLGTACGINLPLIAYRDILGLPVHAPRGYRTGVRWLCFMDDLRAFVKDYHPEGDLTWGQWLASFWCPKVYDTFSWRDPRPWVLTVTRDIKTRAGKLHTRLSRAAHAWLAARGVLKSDTPSSPIFMRTSKP